jgi:hypothetical protein
MHNVFSIDTAAQRHGRVINYLSNLMVRLPSELAWVDLPLVPGQPAERTLVNVVDRFETGCRALLSDAGGTPSCEFHFVAADGQIPAAHKPQSLGDIAAYLTRHEEQTSQVVMAGGIQHGNLTVARAVALMVSAQPLTAAEALQQALEVSARCEAWVRRVADLARAASADSPAT